MAVMIPIDWAACMRILISAAIFCLINHAAETDVRAVRRTFEC